MSNGLLLLGPPYVQVLGGRVSALVEKWELNRVYIITIDNNRVKFAKSHISK